VPIFQSELRIDVADNLEKHRALLEAVRQRDEELVVERLLDMYTRLPDLGVEPRREADGATR